MHTTDAILCALYVVSYRYVLETDFSFILSYSSCEIAFTYFILDGFFIINKQTCLSAKNVIKKFT